MSAIEELKNLEKGGYCFIYNALASRLTALERTVKDYKEAVDMVTAWADERDRQAYEKAIKEIPDEPDRAEIVEPPEFHDFCERIFIPGTDYRTGDIRMLLREHIKELREIVQRLDAGV